MDARLAEHYARVGHLREAFAGANERLVARLRRATDDAAQHTPAGEWSAAQIGWHVAKVTARFAGLLSGDAPGAQPLPSGYVERPWAEVAAAIPEKLQTSPALQPPAAVRREDAIAELEASGMRFARALDRLTLDRATGMGVTHPLTGPITIYQVAEWATAHVIRQDHQAKRVLGEG